MMICPNGFPTTVPWLLIVLCYWTSPWLSTERPHTVSSFTVGTITASRPTRSNSFHRHHPHHYYRGRDSGGDDLTSTYISVSRRYQYMASPYQHKSLPDDWLEGIQNVWNSMNSNDNSNNRKNSGTSNDGSKGTYDDDDDDDLLDLPAGTQLILTIPVKQLKPGGLRLFLMFCLMGLQNTPVKNTWRAHQPITSPKGSRFSDSTEVEVVVPYPGVDDNDDDPGNVDAETFVLEMIHHDKTGTVTIELIPPGEEIPDQLSSASNDVNDGENNNKNKSSFGEIRILRSGSNPSNSYLMNESVILDGILDELHQCAFDETIPVSNRLVVPVTNDAIDVAREELAFR